MAYDEFGMLAEHLRSAERNSRKLARAIAYNVARWQGRLEQRQAFLGRLVDVGAKLFAIIAAYVHARTLAEREPDRAQQAPKNADLFYGQTWRRMHGLFHELWASDDTTNYAAAQRVRAGRCTWSESGIRGSASADSSVPRPRECPPLGAARGDAQQRGSGTAYSSFRRLSWHEGQT